MPKPRVLIVDDSVVVRRRMATILEETGSLRVLRPAANGKIGLSRMREDDPDVIILDIEMPVMDGLETLQQIRKERPSLPVIMFSSLTERGASATLDAIAMGASDYLTKPSSVGQFSDSADQLGSEMEMRILALCERPSTEPRPRLADSAPNHRAIGSKKVDVELLVIGVSTGGPNALAELLPSLPADFPVPILIVQHIPPTFSTQLAERLDRQSALTVREGVQGALAKAGEAWIAPGGFHMVVEGRDKDGVRLALHEGPKVQSCRPAADVLFESAVAEFQGSTLGLVLTGMGQDGLQGCRQIRAAGGGVVVQDAETSVVWGMPGFVAKEGLANRVLPLAEIPAEIRRRCAKSASPAPGRGGQR